MKFTLRQLPLCVKLREDATLDNFYGVSHEPCVGYLKQMVAKQCNDSVSFLWGKSGVGKTHLLQAICHYASQRDLASFYLPLADQQQFSPDILLDLEQLAVICLDDVSAISGLKYWEENLFHLYNRALASGTRLIIADRLPAQDIKLSLKDLHSRLIGSLAFEIDELSDMEKTTVLQMRANARGMELPDDVVQFLLRRCERSMVSLFDVLDQLDHASLSAQKKLTIPFVKAVLGL